MARHPSPLTSRLSGISRRSALGLLGAAPLVTATPAEAGNLPSIPRDLRPGGKLDRFIVDRAARDLFSGTVLLAYRGKPVLECSYGMANKELSLPNQLDTTFDLASVTKTFTAVAIAQLVQRGKVAFHEKLGTYLDGFPEDIANTVTVHQLLTHTSGVGRPPIGSEPPPGAGEWDTVQEVWDGTAKVIRGLPLRFTPGSQWGYSNDGYFVLGEIVAAVSGQSYYDYVREHIFAPAAMTRSDFYTKPQVKADRRIARPYATQRSGERVDFTDNEYFPFVGTPFRGAYSTGPDLRRFVRAVDNGTLLEPAYVDLITRGKMVMSPEEQPNLTRQCLFYGYGFRDTIVNDRRVFGHSGSGPGVGNNLDIFPEMGWIAVILGNYDTSIDPIVELERQLVTKADRPGS